MRVIRLETSHDPRIADYREMSDPELLRRRNLFVAEGRLVVARLLETRHPVTSLLLNASSYDSLRSHLTALPEGTPVYVCDTAAFGAITGFNLHRGCLALAERPTSRHLDQLVESAELVVVLEGITDADNLGSVFRNAAAFGADGVLLSPTCCDPLYRKAIRTSMGTTLKVPYTTLINWPDDLRGLKSRGFTLLGLTPREPAVDLSSCGLTVGPERRLAVLVGTEGSGLTAAAENSADIRVRIPIRRDVDSLNLATATGIALHALSGVIP